MKTGLKQNIVLYAVLAVICLIPSVLVFLLLDNEVQKSDLLIETEAERMMYTLLESFRNTDDLSGILSGAHDVLGFGIYNAQGESLIASGSAPERVDTFPAIPQINRAKYDTEKKSLVLLRRMGVMPPPGERGGMMQMMMPGNRRRNAGNPNRPEIVFFEYDLRNEWLRLDLIRSARYLIPFFVLALFTLFALLIKKNSDYRKKLESQKHLAQLGEMTRTLSHEIKNPLSAIRIQTAYLRKLFPGENQAELGIIEEEVSRLSVLSQKICEFVRDPAGNREEIELHAFIAEIARRYPHPISIEREGAGDFNAVFDRERLRSVVENLIANSLESYEGKPLPETPLEIRLSRAGNGIAISFLDRGNGIAGQDREKAFEPFFSTKAKGTGIGLAIVKRYVEAASGTVRLVEREGGGTEARVFLKGAAAEAGK